MTTRMVVWKELLEVSRDGRAIVAGGLIFMLLASALAVGSRRQRDVQAERLAAQARDYDDWIQQGPRHPHDAAHQGMHVFKPEPPLSIIDPGIEPYVGATIWLQAHRQSELTFRPADDATGLQRFGELSPAWVLQVLGPLFVVILGFNAFAGERERGTLRQTLSLGVSPRGVLLGKVMALGATLAALWVPSGIVAAAMVTFAAPPASRTDALLRMAWLAAGYATYIGIWVFAVLTISARVLSSRAALVVSLGLWIAGTMLIPRLAADLSRRWYPSPTRMTFDSSLDSEIAREASQAWQQNFGVSTPWGSQVPLDKWGIALEVDDQAGYSVMDRHFAELWTTYARQQRAQEWIGLAVPLLAIKSFSMGIAGTDFDNHRLFSVAAEQYRRLIQDTVSADLIEHADPRHAGHFDYMADPSLWRRIPEFRYALPSAWWSLRVNTRSLGVLGVALLVSILLAEVAVVRRPLGL